MVGTAVPNGALGHSLEREPRWNSILNFKNAQLIGMTTCAGLGPLATRPVTQGVLGEAFLVPSCGLHSTCEYLFLGQEKQEA